MILGGPRLGLAISMLQSRWCRGAGVGACGRELLPGCVQRRNHHALGGVRWEVASGFPN